MIPQEIADIIDILIGSYEVEERLAHRIANDIYNSVIVPAIQKYN